MLASQVGLVFGFVLPRDYELVACTLRDQQRVVEFRAAGELAAGRVHEHVFAAGRGQRVVLRFGGFRTAVLILADPFYHLMQAGLRPSPEIRPSRSPRP